MSSARGTPSELEKILQYSFSDSSLLELALTHSSLKQSKTDPSYERLEFLGDRVLGLIIAELLLEQFPKSAEGKLAPRLAALVSGATLADVARSVGLGGRRFYPPRLGAVDPGRGTPGREDRVAGMVAGARIAFAGV